MRAQAPVARSSCRSSIYRTDKGCTTRIHRSRDRCRHMPAPEPKASTPPTSSASDWRLLAPGPPTSSVVIAAGTVDGRHDASWATPSAPPAPSAPPELPAPSAPSAFPEPSAPPLPSPPPASALPPAPLGTLAMLGHCPELSL